MLATIPIDMIEDGQRLRGISEAQVEALVNSIADVGLLNPITVYHRKLLRGGVQVDGYGLVAGLHRKTACERLGLAEIEANVLDLTDLQCQIAECDENLCAPQLSPSDRARFTKRRKEAYEALHPETRHGAVGRGGYDENSGQPVHSFADDTAAAIGVDPRTVRRDAERGEKVAEDALAFVRGTRLDTGTYLDKLKQLPVTDQLKAARDELAKDRPVRRKPARVADAPLNDVEAMEYQVAALMAAWNKASAEAREEFLERIDRPVFDNTEFHQSAPHGSMSVVADGAGLTAPSLPQSGASNSTAVRKDAPNQKADGHGAVNAIGTGTQAPSVDTHSLPAGPHPATAEGGEHGPDPAVLAATPSGNVIAPAGQPNGDGPASPAVRVPQAGGATVLQGREAASRLAHNQEIDGASPSPATILPRRQPTFDDPPHALCLNPGMCGGFSNLALCQRCKEAAGIAVSHVEVAA